MIFLRVQVGQSKTSTGTAIVCTKARFISFKISDVYIIEYFDSSLLVEKILPRYLNRSTYFSDLTINVEMASSYLKQRNIFHWSHIKKTKWEKENNRSVLCKKILYRNYIIIRFILILRFSKLHSWVCYLWWRTIIVAVPVQILNKRVCISYDILLIL